MVKKLLTCASTKGLKPIQVMLWSTFIDWQHPFIFKYQVDKDKYVKFLIPIYQTNKAKAISAKLLELNLKNKLEWMGKTRWNREKQEEGHRKVTERSLKGHWKVTERSRKGHGKVTERSPKGHQKVTERSPKGHRKVTKRSQKGQQKVTKRALKGHQKVTKRSSKDH